MTAGPEQMPRNESQTAPSPILIGDEPFTFDLFHQVLKEARSRGFQHVLFSSTSMAYGIRNGGVNGGLVAMSTRSITAAEILAVHNYCGGEALALDPNNFDKHIDRVYAFETAAADGTSERYRVSLSGHADGVDISFTLIPAAIPTLEDLGVDDRLRQALTGTSGIFIVSGWTGSGRTTLLYSLLAEQLRRPGTRAVTYEHPVERILKRVPSIKGLVHQTDLALYEFGEGYKASFVSKWGQSAWHAISRKPTHIMVGETRDNETVKNLVYASQIGHFVLTATNSRSLERSPSFLTEHFPEENRLAITVELISEIAAIAHQKVVIGVDGEPVMLRAYICFDDQLREQLIAAGPEKLQAGLRDAVQTHGVSLHQAAQKAHREGRITAQTLRRVEIIETPM